MKNSLKNAIVDHHYFEKQNAIHLGEVLSVGFHIKQRNLPHSIRTRKTFNVNSQLFTPFGGWGAQTPTDTLSLFPPS